MEREAKDGTIYRQVGPDQWEMVARRARDGKVYKALGNDQWELMDNTSGFGVISDEQKAKNAQAPSWAPDEDILGAGMRVLDYPFGLLRTGAATLGGLLKGDVQSVVSDEDAKQALKGNAPPSAEYLKRLGVPEMGSLDINPWMEGETTGRDALGFLTDVGMGAGMGKRAASNLKKPSGRFGKPTAEEIEKAAKALSVKPTKGMMTDDYLVRNLEDSLSQSPSIPGQMIRNEREPILNAADDVTREALEGASADSGFQAGKNIKKNLKEGFEKRLEPLEQSYDEIGTHTKHIPVNEKGLKRIAKNIMNIEGAEFKGSDAERVASQFAGWLENAKSVDAIKRLRTKALERARDATKSAEERNAASIIAEKLSKAQSNTITRQAVAIAKEAPVTTTSKGKFLNKSQKKMAEMEAEAEGLDLGRRLVGDIKKTNKGYRSLMEEARQFGKGSGLTKAKAGARGVIDDIENANPQEMAQALFDSGNIEFTLFVKKTYPKAYEMAKGQRLADLAKKVDGDPKKLTKLVSKMSKEEKALLFGDEMAGKIGNMDTLFRALPPKVGASDTPRGHAFQNLGLVQNLNDLGRYGLLKSSGLIGPQMRNAVKNSGKSFGKQGLIHLDRETDERNRKRGK